MKVFIFRKSFDGFNDWCKQITRCIHYLYSYSDASETYRNNHKFEFKENRLLHDRYTELKKALSSKQIEYLDKYLIKNKICEYDYISLDESKELYSKWELVVFPNGKTRINKVTNEEIGKQISMARLVDGRSRKEVAQILGIGEMTLRSYERGDRTLPSDILLMLSQIYGCEITIKEIFPVDESLLFLYED